MTSRVYTNRPQLHADLVKRWPKPNEVSHGQWRDWTVDQRERWLVDHTFEQSEGRWVLRADHLDSTTAQRVEQAVTTFEGAATLFTDVLDQIPGAVISSYEGTRCPRCDTPIEPGDDLCATCRRHDHGISDPEGTKREGYNLALIMVFIVAAVIAAVLVVALLTDWFSGSDEETTPAAPGEQPVTVVPIETIGNDPSGADASLPAGDDVTTGDSTAPADTITFSSIPDHIAYAKTWSDGEVGLTLNPDGTYRYVAAGVDETGRFTMTSEGGVDRIQFLDPDDPSGLYVTGQVSVSIVDGALVYGEGDTARRLGAVDALPVIEASYPPPQRLDYAAAAPRGAWSSAHPGLRWPGSGDTPVSYLLAATAMTGGLDIDLANGTIGGVGTVSFVCGVGRCVNLDTDTATGTATIAIDSGTVIGFPGNWGFEGTATVTADWNATFACTTGTCSWPYTLAIEMPYTLHLVESEGIGYLDVDRTEGVTAAGIEYSMSMGPKIPFVVS